MEWLKLILALVGHLGIFCTIFNQLHATAFNRHQKKASEKTIFLIWLIPLCWVASRCIWTWSVNTDDNPLVIKAYLWLAIVAGIWFAIRWLFRKLLTRLPRSVKHMGTEVIDVRKKIQDPLLAGTKANVLGKIPGNQCLNVAIERFELEFERLPNELDGLKICHISDLHFTGYILPEYFQFAIEQANQFQPDFVFLTGDIVDKMRCIDWTGSILGQCQASIAKYYVLGNHDVKIDDEELIRRKMKDAGFVNAADGQWHGHEFGDARLDISGNEIPWYSHAEALGPAPDESDLAILLSHTPDQWPWAVQRDVNLMFAGHTHGGQIQFPLIGPIVAPSRFGVKYASGTFQFGKMIMHVTRGLSGDQPVRFGCPPEIGFFTLRSGS